MSSSIEQSPSMAEEKDDQRSSEKELQVKDDTEDEIEDVEHKEDDQAISSGSDAIKVNAVAADEAEGVGDSTEGYPEDAAIELEAVQEHIASIATNETNAFDEDHARAEDTAAHAAATEDTVTTVSAAEDTSDHAPAADDTAAHAPATEETVTGVSGADDTAAHTPATEETVTGVSTAEDTAVHAPAAEDTVTGVSDVREPTSQRPDETTDTSSGAEITDDNPTIDRDSGAAAQHETSPGKDLVDEPVPVEQKPQGDVTARSSASSAPGTARDNVREFTPRTATPRAEDNVSAEHGIGEQSSVADSDDGGNATVRSFTPTATPREPPTPRGGITPRAAVTPRGPAADTSNTPRGDNNVYDINGDDSTSQNTGGIAFGSEENISGPNTGRLSISESPRAAPSDVQDFVDARDVASAVAAANLTGTVNDPHHQAGVRDRTNVNAFGDQDNDDNIQQHGHTKSKSAIHRATTRSMDPIPEAAEAEALDADAEDDGSEKNQQQRPSGTEYKELLSQGSDRPQQPRWKRSNQLKEMRQRAMIDGNQGGEVHHPPSKDEGAIRIQKTWRGKYSRKQLRLRNVAAVSIQSVYRGATDRIKCKANIKRMREARAERKERRERLGQIRAKEKDLKILSHIPAEQFMEFERLRKESSARSIQRAWRRCTAGSTRGAIRHDVRKFPRNYRLKSGRDPMREHHDGVKERYGRVMESDRKQEAELNRRRLRLLDSMTEVICKNQSENASSATGQDYREVLGKQRPKYEIEVEALRLLQLYRKVRDSASHRMRQQDLNAARRGFRPHSINHPNRGSSIGRKHGVVADIGWGEQEHQRGGESRWGVRRNYQDLVEAQTKATILLHEYAMDRPQLDAQQLRRHQSLANCKHLVDLLQAPPSLDDARSFLHSLDHNADTRKDGTSAAADEKISNWLVDPALWAPHEDYHSISGETTARSLQSQRSKGAATRNNHAVAAAAAMDAVYRRGQFTNPATAEEKLNVEDVDEMKTDQEAYHVSIEAMETAAEQHVKAFHALQISRGANIPAATNEGSENDAPPTRRYVHWGTVALPLSVQLACNPEVPTGDVGKQQHDGQRLFHDEHSISHRLLTDAKLFRPLAAQWASGDDIQDSLYWIAYATQPSNVSTRTTESADNDNLEKLHTELRKQIAIEAMRVQQRVPNAVKQSTFDDERVDRLAACMKKEMIEYLEKHKNERDAKLYGGMKQQIFASAATQIQAVARGYLSRRKTKALKAQRRVYQALQNLLQEIATAEGGQVVNTTEQTQQALAATLLGVPPRPPNELASNTAVAGSGHTAARVRKKDSLTASNLPKPPTGDVGNDRVPYARLFSVKSKVPGDDMTTPDSIGVSPFPNLHSSDGRKSDVSANYERVLVGHDAKDSGVANDDNKTARKLDYTAVAGSSSVVKRGAWSTNETGTAVTGTRSPRIRSKAVRNVLSSSYTTSDQVGGIGGVAQLALSTDTPLSTPHRPHHTGEAYQFYNDYNSVRNEMATVASAEESTRMRRVPEETELRLPDTPRIENELRVSKAIASSKDYGGSKKDEDSYQTPRVSFADDKMASYASGALRQQGEESKMPLTPGTPGSHALSEFSDVREETGGAAYISSPGHSFTGSGGHSLSRSLSASFGKVITKPVLSTGEFDAEALEAPGSRSPRGNDSQQQEVVSTAGESFQSAPTKLRIASGGSRSAAATATLVEQAMRKVTDRYRTNQCSTIGFIDSTLTANPSHFDKTAALKLLQNLVLITGTTPLTRWLQEFRAVQEDELERDIVRSSASPRVSMILGPGELHVQTAALLITELASELRLLDSASSGEGMNDAASILQRPLTAEAKTSSNIRMNNRNNDVSNSDAMEREVVFNLIQTVMLLRLMGAGTDSGRVRISDFSSIIEDAWLMSVPANGVRVSNYLAQFRYRLLQQATRKAIHPRKLLDDIISSCQVTILGRNESIAVMEEWYEEERVDTAGVTKILVRLYTANDDADEIWSAADEIADAVVKMGAWSDYASSIAISDLSNQLCSLSSFRSLQKRIQTWFRAVPRMHESLKQQIKTIKHRKPDLYVNAPSTTTAVGLVTATDFVSSCLQSLLPLGNSEAFMLSQLLSRKRATSSAELKGVAQGIVNISGLGPPFGTDALVNEQQQIMVDADLLQRVQAGDYLPAAIA